ncbi:GMC family oxidoreductase N-terminal domain-containing protein [Nitrososphaera viennensis]|nr:GMC family oxidoreductase [Nitrososphaera viennensis]UVS70359.1 GMC family oxidoreductase [Nitrososphaera viennensis]
MTTGSGMIYGLEKIRDRRESYTVVTHDIIENADVCVIGSGAAGAIIASKLAQDGKSVVLIEKGGYYDAEDMNQREIEMIPLLWKNGGATFTDNLRMLVVQGQCLGGSTVINDAVCFRTPQVTREQWRGMGANIPDERWDAAIEEVWKAIHASKVQDFELNDNNRMLRRACEAKGYKAGNNDRNCRSCMQCGMCHIGCHYETKQDMLVTYIRKAVRGTGIRIYCDCSAERITYRSGVADGAEGDFVDRATGQVKFKIRVNAKAVVVSAGTIASSQILLKNAIAPDRAGRGLTFHPASFLLGRFQKAINAYDGIPMAYTCHEFGVTNGVRDGGFLIESIFLPVLQFSLGVPSFYESHSLLMDDFVNYAMAGVMVRDEPAGTVSLTAAGNPKVHYEPAPRVIQDFAKGLRVLAEMWFDAGAIEVIGGHRDFFRLSSRADIDKLIHAVEKNPDGLQLASAHPQGGNRMGDDPATCVVDSNCRVHGFSNLFVCDASVFPTAVGVNPQVTVMALATMTADYISKNWKSSFSKMPLSASEGECCSLAQPMYCSAARLEAMFAREKNRMPIETMINAADEEPSPSSWSFDKDSLTIHNDNHWKGFFPVDQDVATMSIKYFGGFWKRFFKNKDGKIAGITHPYDAPVFADNVPEFLDHPRYGKVVHLKYTGAEFAMFYDLLKLVDKDTILGKAFFGVPPEGQQMLVFCMSRKYGVEFMTEKDHEKIFSEHGRAPAADEVLGRWTGRLVSDSALTPRVQTFTYSKDGSGTLQMQYVFGNLLSGISRVSLTSEQMYMYDYTNWHDEVRIVTEDLMVGKWCSPAGQFPLDFGPSFLSVEQVPEGQRFCLRFILRRR